MKQVVTGEEIVGKKVAGGGVDYERVSGKLI